MDRPSRLAAVADVARRQHGVVQRGQLLAAGWTAAQVDHELRVGRWRRPAHGVVAMQNAALTGPQRLWLGVLHAGAGSVLSHLTAARAAGLAWSGPGDVVDVLTPKGDLVAPLVGFRFHQTRRPYREWVRPGPGPPRLPVEHAALLAAERDDHLRRAVGLLAACVQQRLTTAERLLATRGQISRLRHGVLLTQALGDIAGGAQSFAEIDLGRVCRSAGLAPPTRQAPRHDGLRRRYLDAEWRLPDGRVVVLEVDGAHHLRVSDWWQDMRRERAVVLGGSTVLRCSTLELRLQPGLVVHDLRRAGVPSDHGASATAP